MIAKATELEVFYSPQTNALNVLFEDVGHAVSAISEGNSPSTPRFIAFGPL